MLLLQNEMQVADTSRLGGSEKPYRGFESFSLRHTVWSAEKSAWISLEIAGNGRNSATLALKADRRRCPAHCCWQALQPFSPEGIRAVRFSTGGVAARSRQR